MIEGVTFDWWNTLAVSSPDQDRRLRDLRMERLAPALARLPRPPDPKALLAAYDRQTEVLSEAWSKGVDLDPSDQIATFLRFAGLDGRDRELSEMTTEAFGGALLGIPPILFPHVPETLEALRREGYAVGLVSNTGRTWAAISARSRTASGSRGTSTPGSSPMRSDSGSPRRGSSTER